MTTAIDLAPKIKDQIDAMAPKFAELQALARTMMEQRDNIDSTEFYIALWSTSHALTALANDIAQIKQLHQAL